MIPECPECKTLMDQIGCVSYETSDCSCCDRSTYLYQCLTCKRVALA
jgi:hypothetical protein